KYRLRSSERVRKSAIEYKNASPIYSLGDYAELSRDHISKFMLLMEDMDKQGVRVAFFLAPYHPIVFDKITKDYPKVLDSEQFIIDYAKEKSYPVIGSFNPEQTQTEDALFYDGMHLREAGVRKMIKSSPSIQQWLKKE
ncbi:MAG: hypothetical protein AAF738_07910, partial [Bacteroidota bacterium]